MPDRLPLSRGSGNPEPRLSRDDPGCVEIDAEEFEEAARDPAVRDVITEARLYGERVKEEGRDL